MGDTNCKSCGCLNWHIKAHVTGKCENCGNDINWCDSCGIKIPKGGDPIWKKTFKQHAKGVYEKIKTEPL